MGKRTSHFNGMLPVHKPVGMTSHDVVQTLRRILNQRRIGHTGTLDPLAEGLMLVCLGSGTKIARFVTGMDKTYEATIRFGLRSATFDAEGLDPEAEATDVPNLTDTDLDQLLLGFVGRISQQVPLYSAVQVGGERLHRIARRGGEVDRPVRDVTIYEIERLDWQSPDLRIRVNCSSGTYIRTLADDLGRKLGCGAYLAGLKRTRVGHLELSEAFTLDRVQDMASTGALTEHLLDPNRVLQLGAIRVTDEFRDLVIQGRTPTRADIAGFEGRFQPGDHVLLKSTDGSVLAIGTAGIGSDSTGVAESELFTYVRVLN